MNGSGVRLARGQDHAGREGRRTRLGELLVGREALDRTRLAEALDRQRTTGRRLGRLLLAKGWASSGAVAGALAEQWGLGQADLAGDPPDPGLVEPALADLYITHRILPWRRDAGTIVHVTDRPERAAEALAAVGMRAGAVAVTGTHQLDAAFAGVLGQALARRAASRTPPTESVRGLASVRLVAAFAVVALAGAMAAGGRAGLAIVVSLLLIVNSGTTVLRLFALISGLGRERAGRQDLPAGTVGLAPRCQLPVVTLLVPLFREAGMIGEIVRALEMLDYPRELLDVKLLLEEEDAATRTAVGALDLPGWVSPLVVPHGQPRTKPRAMNYALDFAEGEIIGILDAEDRPAPDQVRRVVAALHAAPAEIACVQCQLAYYNATENWITRCFQIEYSIWFDVLLRGFQRLGLPIPLGGTSVYFRRAALERLGGWDAHNVTEDADLGMRIARRGMRCGVLDSVTEEEANCRAGPWIRQRSRWLKGYLLTWLSHMRAPARLWRDLGAGGFLGLNILFLGAAVSYLAMPLFWASMLGSLATGAAVWGDALPGWAVWPLAVSLALGQAVMLGCAALAMLRRGTPGLLVWVPTLPIYWTLGAIAAWKAVIEIVWAPYYWDKTRHGISRIFHQAEARRE